VMILLLTLIADLSAIEPGLVDRIRKFVDILCESLSKG
jgi:hypothetical protein